MSYRDACLELLIADYLPEAEGERRLPSNAEYVRRLSPQFATNQLLTAILLELRQLRREIKMLQDPEAPESEEGESKPEETEPTLPDQAAPTTPAPPPEPETEPEDAPPKEA